LAPGAPGAPSHDAPARPLAATILNERARREGLDIRVDVRNYGRGFYYPSQEVALLFEEWGVRHYSHRFNAFLAQRISTHIDLARLKGTTSSSPIDPGAVTGVSREGGAPTRSPLL
jgi:hypothetical protein